MTSISHRPTKGLHDLADLLANPGADLSALSLAGGEISHRAHAGPTDTVVDRSALLLPSVASPRFIQNSAPTSTALSVPAPAADTNRTRRRGDSLQRAEVLRNVNGVLLQHSQINHLERSSVGCGKHHRWSRPGLMSLKPTLGDHAPAITGLQTRKAILGHWCDQVVPDAPLLLEEFRRYHGTHQMDCLTWSGVAAAIAIEACHWLGTAGLQFTAEDVGFTLHNPSLA